MRLVLADASPVVELAPDAARRAWLEGAGADAGAGPPDQKRIEAAVRTLGGDVDLDAEGKLVYRFTTEARERRALDALRAAAPLSEAAPGAVVFSSD
jgi:hypothetical protein